MKKISVVVPTYRRPHLLEKCLNALNEQQFDSFEVIVVSDGPDNETANKIASCKSRMQIEIRYLPLAVKRGPAAARNHGWKLAAAPLIAFTDDDCIPNPIWLQSIWKSYSTVHNCERYMAFTGRIKVPISERPTDFERNTSHLETADFVTANCACTKEGLMLSGGFDERFTMAWREDSDLEFKLIMNGVPIHFIYQALVIHPARTSRWGVSMDEQKKTMFDALLFKKYPDLFRKKIQAMPAWNYYGMIIGCILLLAGLIIHSKLMVSTGASLYLFLLIRFMVRRLRNTSHSWRHVSEMIYTSVFIPFLSVYWTLYGAFRYRVFYY
jgi:GT2 family glycosyltransferase